MMLQLTLAIDRCQEESRYDDSFTAQQACKWREEETTKHVKREAVVLLVHLKAQCRPLKY